VYCGDDYAASARTAATEILDLAKQAGAELLVAGPAFGSGRYGIACARVAAAASAAGIPALAAMDPSNPGLPEVAPAIAVNSGEAARHMGDALTRMAAAAAVLARARRPARRRASSRGLGRSPPQHRLAHTAAQRAVLLALSRLAGGKQTEIKLPDFGHVEAAAPIADPGRPWWRSSPRGRWSPPATPTASNPPGPSTGTATR